MCIFCELGPGAETVEERIFQNIFVKVGGVETGLADIRIAESCEKLRKNRVPVTLVTGFLGAGKTTLINRILKDQHGHKIAVIENEFGDVSIDDELLSGAKVKNDATGDAEVVLMANGCMCCRVRGDLITAVQNLLEPGAKDPEKKLDAVVIETSGLSEVAPVAQTFFADTYIQMHAQLDCVVTVVDAPACLKTLSTSSASSSSPARKKRRKEGGIFLMGEAEKPPERELLIEQVMLADRILINKIDRLTDESERTNLEELLRGANPSAGLLWCNYANVDMKLITNTNAFKLDTALNGSSYFAESMEDKRRKNDNEPMDRMHVHNLYKSVAFEEKERPIVLEKLQKWIAEILLGYPEAVVRYKGVLWAQHEDHRIIMQGVYHNVDWLQGERWEFGEDKSSKIVFIGKGLSEHQKELQEKFLLCRAPQKSYFGAIQRMGPLL